MTDPMNQLPIDPVWLGMTHTLTLLASEALSCMVLMVAMQEDGKLSVSIEGVPESGPLAELGGDVPRMLGLLSHVLAEHVEQSAQQTRQ